MVGANVHTDAPGDEPTPILSIGDDVEERQRKRLADVKLKRDQAAVDAALARLVADAREPTTNLMPAILDASRAYTTMGEMITALEAVFGRWAEEPVI
jgi:methylmalonyl-CoA mutase N-terminal domain/subunit